MLKKEDWMEIKAQVERGAYVKDIAKDLGVHPKTVSRALKREGAPSGKRPNALRSILDPFKPAIDEMLRTGIWNGAVVLRRLQEMGYGGKTTIVRDYIWPKRPLRKSRATVRFETDPGEQMQSDWGQIETVVAGEAAKVCFTVNMLGFSRRFHFYCTDRMDAEHTYEGIIRAFEHFGGGNATGARRQPEGRGNPAPYWRECSVQRALPRPGRPLRLFSSSLPALSCSHEGKRRADGGLCQTQLLCAIPEV